MRGAGVGLLVRGCRAGAAAACGRAGAGGGSRAVARAGSTQQRHVLPMPLLQQQCNMSTDRKRGHNVSALVCSLCVSAVGDVLGCCPTSLMICTQCAPQQHHHCMQQCHTGCRYTATMFVCLSACTGATFRLQSIILITKQ